MALLVALLAVVAVLELARALPLLAAFGAMAECSQRAMRLIALRGVSEWGKERAMQLLARRLFARSLRAGALLVVVASPFVALLWAGSDPESQLHLDWTTRLWVFPLALGYALFRTQLGRRVQPR
ncbi:hypothetical protein [Sphingomonas hengshuiensis]|uniref:Uncharacterized protein n=1 Tax=Sphingomonas hengshuiensis TaxID=1609977 RepID=A0A7U4JAL1_9SPHN|nr:hypothetical protein [Sphingomonas hengshuiensis]AJP73207.1 hypothetical protein TS85_17535 [Sphingomonas hengshuiensis]